MARGEHGPQRFTNRVEGSHSSLHKPRKTNLTRPLSRDCRSPQKEQEGLGLGWKRREPKETAEVQVQTTLTKVKREIKIKEEPSGSSFVALALHDTVQDMSLDYESNRSGGEGSKGGKGGKWAVSDGSRDEAMLLLNCGNSAKEGHPFQAPFDAFGVKDLPSQGVLKGAMMGEMSVMPVHLFVAAVGDGQLADSTPPKARELLVQIIRKVSKEQNTVVTVLNEGTINIQLRVFASNSVEARALRDYVSANLDQSPAPFVVLARQLPMAVTYNAASLDPSNASVADRLRKQAKTRAIKLLRELIYDPTSCLTSAALRGKLGAMYPAERLDGLINQRAVEVCGQDKSLRFIMFPAIVRSPNISSFPFAQHQPPAGSLLLDEKDAPCLPPPALGTTGTGSKDAAGSGSRHFPVSLMVIAIGDGQLDGSTQPKLLHRLHQVMSKVPKVPLPPHTLVCTPPCRETAFGALHASLATFA